MRKVKDQIRIEILLARKLALAKPGERVEGYLVVQNLPIETLDDTLRFFLEVEKEGRIYESTYTSSFGEDVRQPYTQEEPIFIEYIND